MNAWDQFALFRRKERIALGWTMHPTHEQRVNNSNHLWNDDGTDWLKVVFNGVGMSQMYHRWLWGEVQKRIRKHQEETCESTAQLSGLVWTSSLPYDSCSEPQGGMGDATAEHARPSWRSIASRGAVYR